MGICHPGLELFLYHGYRETPGLPFHWDFLWALSSSPSTGPLIKGINKLIRTGCLPLLFRGLLAVTIVVFMAQPALLYMFKKEITLQTSWTMKKRSSSKNRSSMLYIKTGRSS
jgi:hypothetical protein